jgi:hypothetical protein
MAPRIGPQSSCGGPGGARHSGLAMGVQEMERRAAKLRFMLCGLEYVDLAIVDVVAAKLMQERRNAADD